eukprot:2972740-Rhodomonas_salina.2
MGRLCYLPTRLCAKSRTDGAYGATRNVPDLGGEAATTGASYAPATPCSVLASRIVLPFRYASCYLTAMPRYRAQCYSHSVAVVPEAFLVPPLSYGFAVYPLAKAPACLEARHQTLEQ